MTERKFMLIMDLIVTNLSNRIKNYFGISYNEAIERLYNSKLYEMLDDEEKKMWYYSTNDLFIMFLEETNTGSFTVSGV